MLKPKAFFVIFLVVGVFVAGSAYAAPGPNLVVNPGAEDSTLTGWTTSGAGTCSLFVNNTDPMSGNHDIGAVIATSGTGPKIDIAFTETLEIGQAYRVTFSARCDSVRTATVVVRVSSSGNSGLHKPITITTTDTFYSFTFRSLDAFAELQFFVFNTNGVYYFDDVCVQTIDSPHVYYARADGTCPVDSLGGTTSAGSASAAFSMATVKSLNMVGALSFLPGDSVYFSALGGPYTEELTVPCSGDSTGYIYFIGLSDSTGGYKPLIDVRGSDIAVHAILTHNKNYVSVENFRCYGCGVTPDGGAVVWSGNGGRLGAGYTNHFKNIDVLGNNVRSGGDGFASGSSTNEMAQAELWNITAKNCREPNPPFALSHQALTLHELSKAKVHTAVFDSCNYWIFNTAGTVLAIDDMTATNPLIAGISFPSTATSAFATTITNSSLSLGGPSNSGAKLIVGGTSSCDSAATITISNSRVTLTEPTAASSWIKARVVLNRNTFNTTTGTHSALINHTGTGSLVNTNNRWRLSDNLQYEILP